MGAKLVIQKLGKRRDGPVGRSVPTIRWTQIDRTMFRALHFDVRFSLSVTYARKQFHVPTGVSAL